MHHRRPRLATLASIPLKTFGTIARCPSPQVSQCTWGWVFPEPVGRWSTMSRPPVGNLDELASPGSGPPGSPDPFSHPSGSKVAVKRRRMRGFFTIRQPRSFPLSAATASTASAT